MSDIATALDSLVPAAEYYGSLTANTREAYAALDWRDARPKPTWETVVAERDRLAVLPAPYSVRKLKIVERIIAAGKGAEAAALIAAPENAVLRLKWDAATIIESDHPDTAILRQALRQIEGLDVDAVLAPEEDA